MNGDNLHLDLNIGNASFVSYVGVMAARRGWKYFVKNCCADSMSISFFSGFFLLLLLSKMPGKKEIFLT